MIKKASPVTGLPEQATAYVAANEITKIITIINKNNEN